MWRAHVETARNKPFGPAVVVDREARLPGVGLP
jgi:hypothetical protein